MAAPYEPPNYMPAPWEHPGEMPYYNDQFDALVFRFNSMRTDYDTSRQERLLILDMLRLLRQRIDKAHFLWTCGAQPIGIAERDFLLQNMQSLEGENAFLKKRIVNIEAFFKDPEVQDGNEIKLRPELFTFFKAFKNTLNGIIGNPTTVERPPPPIPAPAYPAPASFTPKYPAPVAEWSLDATQQSRCPTPFECVQTRVAQVKDYFKGSPKPSLAAPVIQYAPPPKRWTIPRVFHQRSFRSYKDLDAAPPAAPKWDDGLYDDPEQQSIEEHHRIWCHRKFNRRTVKVGPFEPDVSTKELLSKLPTTFYIARIIRHPSVEYPGSEVLFIIFLSTANAAEFARQSNLHGYLADTSGAQYAVVKHDIESTTPISPELSAAIYDSEFHASRTLVLEGIPPALWNAIELRSQLSAVFDDESLEEILLSAPQFLTRDTLRIINISFHSVEEALQAWNSFNRKKASGDPMWRCSTIAFKKDPATLPKLQTYDDAFHFSPQPMKPGCGGLTRGEHRALGAYFMEEAARNAHKKARNQSNSTSNAPLIPYSAQSYDVGAPQMNRDNTDRPLAPISTSASTSPEQTDGAQDQADVAAMPTEEGVFGLGISLPVGEEVEEGEIVTVNNTNEAGSSTSASTGNPRPSQPIILIGGNVPDCTGDTDAITIARSMGRSRWAD